MLVIIELFFFFNVEYYANVEFNILLAGIAVLFFRISTGSIAAKVLSDCLYGDFYSCYGA
jgi:hypothetical protein